MAEETSGAAAPTVSIYDVIRGPQKKRSLRRLPSLLASGLRLVWEPSPRTVVAAFAWQVVAALLLLGQLAVGRYLLAEIVADDTRGLDFADLLPAVAALGVLSAAAGLASALSPERQRMLGELVRRHAMHKIVDVTTRVDLEAFEAPRFHDALMRARIQSQVRPMQLANGLLMLAQGILTSAAIFIALGVIQPLLIPLVVLAYVPMLWASNRNSRELHKVESELTAGDRERTYLEEVLTGKDAAKEVRAFRLPAFLQHRYDELWDERIRRQRTLSRGRLWRSFAATIASTAALVGGLALLVWMVATDRTTVATAATAAVALQLLGTRLRTLNQGASSIYECSLFLDDVSTFLALAPAVADDTRPTEDPGALRSIAVEGVSFRYPGTNRTVLDDVSFEINAGEIVALVGENGSGKTTLAKLLCGLYTPTSGAIRWNDRDIKELDPDKLRRQVGAIFQDFIQYQLPVKANIGIGRHEAFDDQAAIEVAASMSGADEFIRTLHAGYDTLLSRAFMGGVELSIGQWQRIALARAFFADAPLLILDEPTASLDPRAEQELFASMRDLARGRTVLLISHRFSSVRSADRILVLDKGSLVEAGNHEELVERGGLYEELFALQAQAYAGNADKPIPGSR